MKKTILSFAIALFATALWAQNSDSTSSVSQCKPVTIKFLGFDDYRGHRLKPASLRNTLACANDKKVMDSYKTGHAMGWIGSGLVTAGSILVLSASGNSYEYSDQDLKLGLLGLETMAIGVGVQFGGVMVKKSAVRRYNQLAAGNLSPVSPGKAADSRRYVGFSFGKTFFKRGVKLPEVLYSGGFYFDENREIANSGFYLNLFTEHGFGGNFLARGEFNWAQRGFGIYMHGTDYSYEATTRSYALNNYLEVAALGQYRIEASKSAILISAGPGLGFLASSKIKSRATVRDLDTGESSSASASEKGNLESLSFGDRTDFGIHLGFGSRLPLGGNHLSIDIRYFLGLKNVNKSEYDTDKQFNRGWMLGIGYVLGM